MSTKAFHERRRMLWHPYLGQPIVGFWVKSSGSWFGCLLRACGEAPVVAVLLSSPACVVPCSGCSTHFPAQIHLNNTSLLKSKPPHLKSKNRNITKLIHMNSYLQQIERETSHILCLNTVCSSLQRNYGTSQPFHHQKKPQKDKKNSNMKFKPQNKFSLHSLGKKPLHSWTSWECTSDEKSARVQTQVFM